MRSKLGLGSECPTLLPHMVEYFSLFVRSLGYCPAEFNLKPKSVDSGTTSHRSLHGVKQRVFNAGGSGWSRELRYSHPWSIRCTRLTKYGCTRILGSRPLPETHFRWFKRVLASAPASR